MINFINRLYYSFEQKAGDLPGSIQTAGVIIIIAIMIFGLMATAGNTP